MESATLVAGREKIDVEGGEAAIFALVFSYFGDRRTQKREGKRIASNPILNTSEPW
jgi:hypothetical protein